VLLIGIKGEAFATVVADPPWPASLLQEVVAYVEELQLRGLGERCLTILARRDPERSLSIFSERLQKLWHREIVEGKEPPDLFLELLQPREERYGSYMADVAGEAIELGLITALNPDLGQAALTVLQRWQELNHIGDKLGPYTGAGTQWTQYEIEHLGFMWALVAALMLNVPGAARWCAEQPASLLREIPETDAGEVLLLAMWVLHIAAAAEAEDIYEEVRIRIERAGGISEAWLGMPASAAPGEDGDWNSVFQDKRLAPTPEQLGDLTSSQATPPGDAVALALDALLEDPILRPDDGSRVTAILSGGRDCR
jgi:hypothetical protein